MYLRQKGYDEATIQSLLAAKGMDESILEKLARENSRDVRFLVARNPTIPDRLLDALLHDDSDFVRSGAALNPKLTEEQALAISKSGSHTSKASLAKNPSLSDDILVDLHEKHGVELKWFAQNPRCPAELIEKINATNDERAMYWLKVTRDREDFKKKNQEKKME